MVWNRLRSRREALQACTLAALIAALFGFYATGLSDIDVWWHLASGRFISQTGSLPQGDPFFMYPMTGDMRQEIILQGAWLGQYLFYRPKK